jgi:DNA-binding transcriptional LysR family regulator
MGNEAFASRSKLFSEQYVVVLPADQVPDHLGTLSDIAQQLQFMHYSARSVIGMHISSYLRGTDPEIERSFEFDATDPLLALVSAGLGFAITTPLCLWQSRYLAQSVKVLPLTAFKRGGKPYPPFSRSLYLISRQGELGSLPGEICEIVDIAARSLKREIMTTLNLEENALSIDR